MLIHGGAAVMSAGAKTTRGGRHLPAQL